jgi:hypothetical protein
MTPPLFPLMAMHGGRNERAPACKQLGRREAQQIAMVLSPSSVAMHKR